MLKNCGSRLSRISLGNSHCASRAGSVFPGFPHPSHPRRHLCLLHTSSSLQYPPQPHLRRRHPIASHHIRTFRTSQGQHAPPLLVLMVFKPIAKLTAILSGRIFRNWWRGLPKHRSESISETLRRDKWKIVSALCGLLAVGSVFYLYHVEEAPITHRRRFLALNDKQCADITEVEFNQHLKDFGDSLLPETHPLHEVVERIANHIVRGNQDLHQIRDREWTVHVVNKDLKNAFVLPNGHIFVFTGLFKTISNEQQLGIVLAHEISHVVLNHAAEQISLFELVDFGLILILGAIWAILPNDGLAVVATWFKNKVAELLLKMPYSRLLETEADEVGLLLAAKACLDVRESQCFWEAMDEHTGNTDDVALLSTHPSNSQRAKHLQELIPQAIKVREYCDCPPLPHRDPRTALPIKAAPVPG